jgi:D-apionate oxidoisomerase
MTVIALFGAGGKMGLRLARNLRDSRFTVRHVEVSAGGRTNVEKELGLGCVSPEEALVEANVVILAVPDTAIGKVAASLQTQLKPGTMVNVLDAAAPYAGHLPDRKDLIYFVTHPCHPPIFNDETDMVAKKDYFGGIAAKQHIVNALTQGPESAYAVGDEIARTIWAPVMRSHRVTVAQMALLEPGLSETV